MSMQQYSGGPNPFAIAGRFIAQKYKEGARSQRDVEQHNLTQSTLAMHAAQHEATKRQASQQARLTEKSERGKHERAIHLKQRLFKNFAFFPNNLVLLVSRINK